MLINNLVTKLFVATIDTNVLTIGCTDTCVPFRDTRHGYSDYIKKLYIARHATRVFIYLLGLLIRVLRFATCDTSLSISKQRYIARHATTNVCFSKKIRAVFKLRNNFLFTHSKLITAKLWLIMLSKVNHIKKRDNECSTKKRIFTNITNRDRS